MPQILLRPFMAADNGQAGARRQEGDCRIAVFKGARGCRK
jgi:hypothetical protein